MWVMEQTMKQGDMHTHTHTPWVRGFFSESISSSQGPTKTQGRHMRALDKRAGPGENS